MPQQQPNLAPSDGHGRDRPEAVEQTTQGRRKHPGHAAGRLHLQQLQLHYDPVGNLTALPGKHS